MSDCKHKWKFSHSESYSKYVGRNNNKYVKINYYYCKKCCLEEDKTRTAEFFNSELWRAPEWVQQMTQKQ